MYRAVVTGSNRGLGLEFVRALLEKDFIVYATCRVLDEADELKTYSLQHPGKLHIEQVDITRPEDVNDFARKIATVPIDLLVNNAGIKGVSPSAFPNLNGDNMLHVMNVNAVATLLFTQALQENVAKSTLKQIVALSSGVSSITDNMEGGMCAYRMSKCALNMGMREVAIKLADQGVHVVLLVPGWARTRMGGPNGRLSPSESVNGLMEMVIDRQRELESGCLYDYKGQKWQF